LQPPALAHGASTNEEARQQPQGCRPQPASHNSNSPSQQLQLVQIWAICPTHKPKSIESRRHFNLGESDLLCHTLQSCWLASREPRSEGSTLLVASSQPAHSQCSTAHPAHPSEHRSRHPSHTIAVFLLAASPAHRSSCWSMPRTPQQVHPRLIIRYSPIHHKPHSQSQEFQLGAVCCTLAS